jgi:hypothetical protein
MIEPASIDKSALLRIRIGLAIAIAGLIVFIVGADPGLAGLDRSPVVGFVQIAVFLFGLALIALGGYLVLNGLWNGAEKTIAADIGYRLISTGYVVAVASGMADIFGFGSQLAPGLPYFGMWQAIGVLISMLMMAAGFLMMIPYPHAPKPPQEIGSL